MSAEEMAAAVLLDVEQLLKLCLLDCCLALVADNVSNELSGLQVQHQL